MDTLGMYPFFENGENKKTAKSGFI